MTPYRERQLAQLAKHKEWQKAQGGLELPVRLTTLLKPEQQKRIRWLRRMSVGVVLEVGTSWGYVLAAVTAGNNAIAPPPDIHVGLDIAEWNVDLARLLCPEPNLRFDVGDALSLPYPPESFDTVILAEVLEHLAWPDGVFKAVANAKNVARNRVLITVPDGRKDTDEARSPKHQYLMDLEHLEELLTWLPGAPWQPRAGFMLIAWRKPA